MKIRFVIPEKIRFGPFRPPKPQLRGIPDIIATILSIPAAIYLVKHANPGDASTSALVYGICLVMLYAVSAAYHTPNWTWKSRRWLRRMDHSTIYIHIAGCYTPFCLLLLERNTGRALLWVIWGCAVLGMFKSFFWPRAPRQVNTAIYLLLGWLVVPYSQDLYRNGGGLFLTLVAAGGLLYTVGAIV